MAQYVLLNIIEKENFEKTYQLPYGCGSGTVYSQLKDAIQLLLNMGQYDRSQYVVELWENGEFKEIVIYGRDIY